MQDILEHLFRTHRPKRDKYTEEINRIAANEGMLKKDFNKWQRVRLLDIIDDKDLIAAKWAEDSFSEGVRYGVRFMVEALNKE